MNVALIGYAFMGKAHSNAYRQVSRFFSPRLTPRLKVLCGRTPARVEAAASQLGWEETATDWRQIVDRRDIDIVDICTPGDMHAEIAIAAAHAGKVVFCEKPLAHTTRDAERMLAAVQQAGVAHMVCHNYRRAHHAGPGHRARGFAPHARPLPRGDQSRRHSARSSSSVSC